MENSTQDVTQIFSSKNYSMCYWHGVFDDSLDKIPVRDFMTTMGTLTTLVTIAVLGLFDGKKFWPEKFYNNLLNFFGALLCRRGIPTVFYVLHCIDSCLMDDLFTCKMVALGHNFIRIFEIESLAQICIERYVDIKYQKNGKPIPEWHNRMYRTISLVLAAFYSIAPVVGMGRYCKDFTCQYCTSDVLLSRFPSKKYIAFIFFLLQDIKPIVTILIAIVAARYYMKPPNNLPKVTKCCTNVVAIMSIIYVLFSLPMAIMKFVIVLVQVCGSELYLDNNIPKFINTAYILEAYNGFMAVVAYMYFMKLSASYRTIRNAIKIEKESRVVSTQLENTKNE